MFYLILLPTLVWFPMYVETLSSCPVQSSHSLHLCLSSSSQWPGLISSLSSRHFAYPWHHAPKLFLAFLSIQVLCPVSDCIFCLFVLELWPSFALTSESMADHRTMCISYQILTVLPKFYLRFYCRVRFRIECSLTNDPALMLGLLSTKNKIPTQTDVNGERGKLSDL